MKIYLSNKIHPHTPDAFRANNKIIELPAPKEVIIPLSQHVGAPAEPLVNVGDTVKVGTKIGQSSKFISSSVHSSISGTVTRIDKLPHPIIGEFTAIVIEADGRNQVESLPLKSGEMLEAIKEAGIVGQGGASFPTNVKLSPPKEARIDTFILNGAECEPFLSCDSALMIEKAPQIIEGVEIIAKIIGVEKSIIAIENNKPDAIRVMRDALIRRNARYLRSAEKPAAITIVELPTQYPIGAEKTLIKKLLNREVPSGKLPFNVGCLVHNVATAFAIQEAVYLKKPLYERIVTVTGDCIEKPQNLRVRVGTPVKELINFCGRKKDPQKIILGGPMMGISQYCDDVPIMKATSGVLCLSADYLRNQEQETDCIRCGRCLDACPAQLEPAVLAQAVEINNQDMIKQFNINDCVECGACSYACPARIDLVGWIKLGKLK